MEKSYVVRVNDVPPVYPANYFLHGRKFRYKRDAITCAKEAIAHGATMARVECPNGGELDFRPQSQLEKELGELADAARRGQITPAQHDRRHAAIMNKER